MIFYSTRFLKWPNFQKNHRYFVGERVTAMSLSVLELLIAANYKKEKLLELTSANIEIQKLRFLIRLGKDLKLL